MRGSTVLLLLCVQLTRAIAQDPDQNPYWTRYTIVEDSDQLTPLKGKYVVHFIQRGRYWTAADPEEPILDLPEKSMPLQPVFGAGYPTFQATPARGTEQPDAKLVVLRGLDTMIVEIMAYYPRMGSLVNERCKHLDCARRPPIVMPFRPGRYHPDGHAYGYDMNRGPDPRTVELTDQFDALWKKAMKADHVIPQLNTDTGWAERIPFDLTQMDWGMPWADWEDHVVMMLPLHWWVAAHQPEGKKELVSGSYRLRFVGANMKALWTRPFVLDP
jgi:hypothetical protein